MAVYSRYPIEYRPGVRAFSATNGQTFDNLESTIIIASSIVLLFLYGVFTASQTLFFPGKAETRIAFPWTTTATSLDGGTLAAYTPLISFQCVFPLAKLPPFSHGKRRLR